MFELRPYQVSALNQIRKLYIQGKKKVLLHLSTGAGKTVIFCQILKGAHEKNKNAIMVVRGRKLVDQASKRLSREGVPHGVLMAGHKNWNPTLPIQVCSIDTLRARKLKPAADIIVIDEAHLATSSSYVEFLNQYPDSYFLPVTATPYTDKPLNHMATDVIMPITISQLIADGYLVPPKYFSPKLPDLSGVRTVNTSEGKDFNSQDLEQVMQAGNLMGDIAEHWLNIAKGRPTLAFCVSVEHSKNLARKLNEVGIRTEHVDASSTDEERQACIDRLERGEIDVISNCGILCTGVDIPSVSCIIMARPTKSLNLYIQQAGRGTRPLEGKSDFIILDHAGNVLRHKFITDEHEVNLNGKSAPKEKEIIIKTCECCYAVFRGPVCPVCGNQNESKVRKYSTIDGELKELKPEDLDPVDRFIKQTKQICKERGYKRGWVYFQVKERFGEAIADRHFPKREIPWWVKSRAQSDS